MSPTLRKILVINPGSTSTKVAVYHDERPVLIKTIHYSADELAQFPDSLRNCPRVASACWKRWPPKAFPSISMPSLPAAVSHTPFPPGSMR